MAKKQKGIFLDMGLNEFIKQNTMTPEEFERRQAELAAQDEEDAPAPEDKPERE